jgi:hypothetical protein
MTKTYALQNLWGFRWIDTFMGWPMPYRIPTLFVMALLPVGALGLIGIPLPQIANFVALLSIFLSTLTVWVILARGAQDDFESMGHAVYARSLEPNPVHTERELVGGVVFGIFHIALFDPSRTGHWTGWLSALGPEGLDTLGWRLWARLWVHAIVTFWGGIVMIHLLVFLARQYDSFSRLAREVRIDLSDLEDVQIFARPLLRYLLVVILVTVLIGLFYQFTSLSLPQREEVLFRVFIPGELLAFLIIIVFVRPVLIVRDRIKATKINELMQIRKALGGDRSALSLTQIAHIANEFSAPDLMMYQERVTAIWEWPVQQHMQRLAFYILIPPFAWIMAALVERVLDVYL